MKKNIFVGGEYHKHDFFVYPMLEKGVLRRVWEKAVGLIQHYSEAKGAFAPPSTEEMVKQCFYFYLEPYKNILLNEASYPQDFRLNEFVREVKHIFEQHEKLVVELYSSSCITVTVDNIKVVSSLFI